MSTQTSTKSALTFVDNSQSQAFLMSAPMPPPYSSSSSTSSSSSSAEKDQQVGGVVTSKSSSIPIGTLKFNIAQDQRDRSDSGLNLPEWATSPPFSSTSGFSSNFSAYSMNGYGNGDDEDEDRTPMNSFKPECTLTQFTVSRASSCLDSGTESIDAGDCCFVDCSTGECLTRMVDSKQEHEPVGLMSSTASTLDTVSSSSSTGRRLVPDTILNDNDDDLDDDCGSDSTLSESSLSPTGEYSHENSEHRITPELVVAAIDKKIKEQKHLLKAKKKRKQFVKNKSLSKNAPDGESDEDEENDALRKSACHNSEERNKPKNDCLHIPSVVLDESSTDDDFNSEGRIPLIRSTSLKTGKTPPGTPGTKKIVRFADAMGLDLESIRTIAYDVPYVPPVAAFKGLALEDDDIKWIYGQRAPSLNESQPQAEARKSSPTNLRPTLRMLFCQPISDPGPFMERVRNFKVCLENCILTGPCGPTDMFDLTCVIRVANLGFEKAVNLRYTTNEWLTWTDVVASYVPHSCDGFSDKFAVMFHIAVNSNGHQSMMPGQRLLFCIKYLANGNQEFWDNNMGLNYALIYQRS